MNKHSIVEPQGLNGADLSDLQALIEKKIALLTKTGFFPRLCAKDAALWSSIPEEIDEINHRMDWLEAPRSGGNIVRIAWELRAELLQEGFTHAVVLGMGGSSLAPEVYSRVMDAAIMKPGARLSVLILDTTDPLQISEVQNQIDISKTIFIISSKSGTTAEVNALLSYFWDQVINNGIQFPGRHFIAISDPATALIRLAQESEFRRVLEANPNVGGRFSALIEFGMIPAVLCGYDGNRLLNSAEHYMFPSGNPENLQNNLGVILGIGLAQAFAGGRDKLTIMTDFSVPSFGAWLEQLVAESTGKSSVGILPIDGEPLLEVNQYGRDRLFVQIGNNASKEILTKQLRSMGHPVITMPFGDLYDLAALFFVWEVAVAVTCALIGVNAFNQPDVQMSKTITTQLINELQADRPIDLGKSIYSDQTASVYGNTAQIDSQKQISFILDKFFIDSTEGNYISINAFIPQSAENMRVLHTLRKKLSEKFSLPTTLGFGPRYLHSTGQLHKGGKNNGFFIVLTEEKEKDIEIPGRTISFGNLQLIQAIGDTRALEQMGRRVIRIHLQPSGLQELLQIL